MMGEISTNDQIAGMEVQVLAKKIIKPSIPTPNHLQIHKLCFFDQLSPKAHVPLVYFYPLDSTVDESRIANRLQQLEKSLSEILCYFPPLAGRMAEDGLSVDCRDQGVMYVEAKVNSQLNEFLREACKDIDLVSRFVPWDIGEASAITTPLVGVQVTEFACGGLALAVHCSHVACDGFIGCSFTAEWAKLCRSGTKDLNKCLSFDVHSFFPARDLSGVLKPFPPFKPAGPRILTKMLLFDEAAISKLKEMVKLASDNSIHPSRVEVLTALIWRGLIRASRARHNRLRTSLTSLAVNLRGKTSLGAAENSFGNLYIQVPIKFMADESKMELHDFVHLIRSTIKKTLADCAKASSDEIFSMAVEFHNQIREGVGDDEVDVRICTSLCRFPLYEADFGWGKPSWISSVNSPFEIFSLMDSKDGSGIEARVNLNELEMPKFVSDPEISPFSI